MGPEPECDRWLSIAEKLLAASDLIGSRRFAERALESDPLNPSDRADRIIAVADVILASQTRLHSQPDPHSILNVTPGSDPSSILSTYRRLSRLLNPNSNHLPFAAQASKLVSDAYSVLSGPGKGSAFASNPNAAATAAAAKGDELSFWTVCPSCCHVYLYDRAYVGMELKCQKCAKGFRADELASPPPVVEGTDLYYCTWGYFPTGVSGPQQPLTPQVLEATTVPAGPTAPTVPSGRVKKMAGKKRKAGLGRNGGIDINQGFDDEDEDDDDDDDDDDDADYVV